MCSRIPCPAPQTGDDVRFIRKVLDDAGGYHVKIISKIENEAGLLNMDGILEAGDGVMVARGDLAMEVRCCCIPSGAHAAWQPQQCATPVACIPVPGAALLACSPCVVTGKGRGHSACAPTD